MDKERIESLFKLLGSKVTGHRGLWVQGHCVYGPWRHGGKDKNPSFGIKAGTAKNPTSFYKCQSCGMGGDLMDLILDLKRYIGTDPIPEYKLGEALQLIAEEEEAGLTTAGIPDYDDVPEDTEIVFPEPWLASFGKVGMFPVAMEYCFSRGLPPWVTEKLDMRYDPVQKRVCFPYRDRVGRLMGMQGRSIEANTDLRYYQYGYNHQRNPHNWLGEDTVDLDEVVVLVEGPFDLASIMRVYPNVMASFTSGLSTRKLDRISDAREIVTFYDHGSGGNAAREKIRKRCKKAHVVDIVPTKQEDDAGSMSSELIASYLSDHVSLC